MSFLPLSVKRLTASDLTFFRWHFENRNAGNQKAINLNADVFIDELFPALPRVADRLNGRIAMDLRIFGPDGAPEYQLQRKIIKGGSYKNWRLDGEFVHNPEDAPDRFNTLEPGDFVLFRFETPDGIVPHSAALLFVAGNCDPGLHRALEEVMGTKKMMVLGSAPLSALLSEADVPDGHPFFNLVTPEDAADAGSGAVAAVGRLKRRRGGRPLSKEELRKARGFAEALGERGEELINGWLEQSGAYASHTWVSALDAVSPFDFEVESTAGAERLEVKTTSHAHTRPFHISVAELDEAATSQAPYRIARVSALDDSGADLRISEPIHGFAREVLAALDRLPNGVSVASVVVETDRLEFGEAQRIDATEP